MMETRGTRTTVKLSPRALETYLQRRTKGLTPAVSINGLIDDILHKYFAKYESGMTVQQGLVLEAGIIPVNLRT